MLAPIGRAAIALGILLAGVGQSLAQDRSEVREVLNRAETQAARRAVQDLLGSIGVTRAQAQTAPQRGLSVPGQPTPQPATQPASDSAAGAPAAPAAPPVVAQGAAPAAPAAGAPIEPLGTGAPAAGAGTPAAGAPAAGAGTPTDPTMIVRIPGAPQGTEPVTGATAPAGSAPAATPTAGQAGRAVDTSTTVAAPPASAPGAPVAHGPRGGQVRILVGRGRTPEWCPPARW